MKFNILHITDHALIRWKERVKKKKKNGFTLFDEITESVKFSKIIKKKEYIPFGTPRKNGTVYSFNNEINILFVMESITIDEYRLVTVISHASIPRKNLNSNFGICKYSRTKERKNV